MVKYGREVARMAKIWRFSKISNPEFWEVFLDTQGAVQRSINGSMGSYDVLLCHKRGYTGFQDAVHWSLSGSRWSYGVLQSHMRSRYTGFQVAVQWYEL